MILMDLNDKVKKFVYSEGYRNFLINYDIIKKKVYLGFLRFYEKPSKTNFEYLKRGLISKKDVYADLQLSYPFHKRVKLIADLLKEKSRANEGIAEILHADSLYDTLISEILEILYPTSFMIYWQKIANVFEFNSANYVNYLKRCRTFISKYKPYLDNFLDLHLFLYHAFPNIWNLKKKNETTINIPIELSELKNMTLLHTNTEKITKIRMFLKDMSRSERNALLRNLQNEDISPYILNVIKKDTTRGLVIDGSNISYDFSDAGRPTLDSLRQVLSLIKRSNEPVFYPVYIIFDSSLKYRFRGYERERFEHEFLAKPSVVEVKQADPFILNFARTQKFAVLSNDKFLEWDTDGIVLYHISREGIIEQNER
ncbi:MAG: hypothetical protein DRP50_05255 [Thermotoga sp.]|nr:MAG: hypothetical protein DRP50_05255 [Thermotoga sp.]